MAVPSGNIKRILLGTVLLLFLTSSVNAAQWVDIDVLVSGLQNGRIITLSENIKNTVSDELGNGPNSVVFENYKVKWGMNNDDYFDIKVVPHPNHQEVCHVALGSYTQDDEQRTGPKVDGSTYVHHMPMVICRDKDIALPPDNFDYPVNPDGNFAEIGTESVTKESYCIVGGKEYWVYYPTSFTEFSDGSLPLIVFGNGATTIMSDYEKGIKILASKGFIVIGCESPPELPGCGNNAGDYIIGEDLIIAYEKFKKEFVNKNDIKALIDKVDPSKIGIVGVSAGGGGGFALMKEHSEIKTAVLLDPCYPSDERTIPVGNSRSMLIIDNDDQSDGGQGDWCPNTDITNLYAGAAESIPVARITLPENYGHVPAITAGFYHTAAWLELKLMGNGIAESIFYGGEESELHTDPPYEWKYIDACLSPESKSCEEYLKGL